MKELYDIPFALKLEKKWRVLNWLIYLPALAALSFFLTVSLLRLATWLIMISSITLGLSLWLLLTYYAYWRKSWKQEYHFLAKVEQMPREKHSGPFSISDAPAITIEGRRYLQLQIEGKLLYIEVGLVSFLDGKETITVESMDGIVVAYEG